MLRAVARLVERRWTWAAALLIAGCGGGGSGGSEPKDAGCSPDCSLAITSSVHDVSLALSAVAIGDLDDDGHADVAATLNGASPDQPDAANLVVLWGKGDGSLSDPELIELPGAPTALRVADMSSDSIADVLVYLSSTESWSVLVADGDGGFDDPVEWAPSTVEGARYDMLTAGSNAVVADVSGDGTLDIVSAPDSASPAPTPSADQPDQPRSLTDLIVLVGAGDGSVDRAMAVPLDPSDTDWSSSKVDDLATGDSNGDGDPDVIAVTHTALFADDPTQPDSRIGPLESSEQLLFTLINEDGTLAQKKPPESLGADVTTVAAGDFDGDGSDDIVPVSPEPTGLVAVDLEGDGALELVTVLDSTMRIRAGASAGDSGVLTASAPGPLQGVAAGDLDGDGLPEIVATYRVWNAVDPDPRRRTLKSGGLWIRSPSLE